MSCDGLSGNNNTAEAIQQVSNVLNRTTRCTITDQNIIKLEPNRRKQRDRTLMDSSFAVNFITTMVTRLPGPASDNTDVTDLVTAAEEALTNITADTSLFKNSTGEATVIKITEAPSQFPSILFSISPGPSISSSISSEPSPKPSTVPSITPSSSPSSSPNPTNTPNTLSLETSFNPSEILQGNVGSIIYKVTTHQAENIGHMSITSTLDEILQITNIASSDGWDCSASNDQFIDCSASSLPEKSTLITVHFSALSFESTYPISCDNKGGSDFFIKFENGSFLRGCSNGGPVYLDGTDITEFVSTKRNSVTLNGISLDLTCEDRFPDGWSELDGYGPKQGDEGMKIHFFQINRFNQRGFIKSCGNTISSFTVDNTVTLSADSNSLSSSDTLKVNPDSEIKFTESDFFIRGKTASIKTNFLNNDSASKTISGLWVCFDGSLGLLNNVNLKCRDWDMINLWTGVFINNCEELSAKSGWTGGTEPTIYANSGCEIEFLFDLKKRDPSNVILDFKNSFSLDVEGVIYDVPCNWESEDFTQEN